MPFKHKDRSNNQGFLSGIHWPAYVSNLSLLRWGGDSWNFTSIMSKMGSRMPASFWWIHRHYGCGTRLHKPRLFRASASTYRHWLMGLSQQQQCVWWTCVRNEFWLYLPGIWSSKEQSVSKWVGLCTQQCTQANRLAAGSFLCCDV